MAHIHPRYLLEKFGDPLADPPRWVEWTIIAALAALLLWTGAWPYVMGLAILSRLCHWVVS